MREGREKERKRYREREELEWKREFVRERNR